MTNTDLSKEYSEEYAGIEIAFERFWGRPMTEDEKRCLRIFDEREPVAKPIEFYKLRNSEREVELNKLNYRLNKLSEKIHQFVN